MWGETPRSFRWLRVHIRNLPHESQTSRLLNEWKPNEWGNVEELLAATVNELRAANHLFLKANVKKGTHIPEPQMVRRPDPAAEEDRRRPASPEELAAALKIGPGRVRYSPKNDDTETTSLGRRRVEEA